MKHVTVEQLVVKRQELLEEQTGQIKSLSEQIQLINTAYANAIAVVDELIVMAQSKKPTVEKEE